MGSGTDAHCFKPREGTPKLGLLRFRNEKDFCVSCCGRGVRDAARGGGGA